MTTEKLLSLKEDLTKLCAEVSVFVREEIDKVSHSDIETKDLNSLVSYVDKEAERKIVTALKTWTPQAGFITEEDTVTQEDKPLIWIIDPLDGTTNYLHNIPHFSISIALMGQGKVILGIVYEVVLDRAFTAIKGLGAWENDKPVLVKPTKNLIEAIVVTGFPYNRNQDIDKNLAILKFCILNCRGLRRLGSAALDLVYVATGKIDIYYENSLNIWDIAAGALIVQEAGGQVSGFNNTDHLKSGSIIASNKNLHAPISSVINNCLN